MSDEDDIFDEDDAALREAAFEDLKKRADLLGVKYHPSIGEDTLIERVREAQAKAAEAEQQVNVAQISPAKAEVAPTAAQKARQVKDKALELVRVRVTCMNPAKTAWPGEIIEGGNRVCSVKKYVPFTGIDWHVPRIILNILKNRYYQSTYEESVNGNKVSRGRLVKEFAIEYLPSLTEAELKDLAQRQQMAGGTRSQ